MRRLSIYILIFLVNLNTSFFFEELFKVPVLVQHYLEHQQKNSCLEFGDFLAMHYWGEDIDDKDDERDMQLPFKKLDHNDVTHFVYIPNRIYTSTIRNIPVTTQQENNFEVTLHSNPHLGALFRPPIV